MSGTETQSDLIHSELGDPEAFGEIVELFLEQLPKRLDQLEAFLNSADYRQLALFTHQLKGAGGGYGYPGLTQRAAKLEAEARQPQPSPSVLRELFRAIRDYQQRMCANPIRLATI